MSTELPDRSVGCWPSKNPPSIEEMEFRHIEATWMWSRRRSQGLVFRWGVPGFGFGCIEFEREQGKNWYCDDEFTGRDFVERAMRAYLQNPTPKRKATNRRWNKRRAKRLERVGFDASSVARLFIANPEAFSVRSENPEAA